MVASEVVVAASQVVPIVAPAAVNWYGIVARRTAWLHPTPIGGQ